MLTVWRFADQSIVLVVMAMLGLGLLAIFSAGYHLHPNHYFYFCRQLFYIGLGTVSMLIGACVNYGNYRFRTQVPYILGTILLAAVFILGNQSWLPIGGGFHLQPSEIAKLIIIVYLSYFMSFERGTIHFMKHSVPIMLTCGILILMTALQPDFGTALVMTALTVYLLFIGNLPLTHMIIPVAVALPAVVSVPFFFPHVMKRIVNFSVSLLPGAGMENLAHHDLQFRLAIGSGGFFGTGFGQGIVKRSVLPASHTDSIYAVLVEEGGFLTGAAVICLFLALLLIGERTARFSHDRFGALLARGIVFYIVIQAFLNISVCLGLFPNTGVTLPLFSYGGSSIIVTMYALGVLVNISAQRIIMW
ncbi:FtsW/RodA/SpoVE family cell cycle protein [bacterium]|nr:FtsW/RodA/SpoVE family cell cycle protein [candidate division CSSED10-310 bacterium]